MAGGSLEELVQQAVDYTDIADVLMEDRMVLFSDSRVVYISQTFFPLYSSFAHSQGLGHTAGTPVGADDEC